MLLKLQSGKTITATATRNNGSAPWQPSGLGYKITMKTDGKQASFDFWDSHFAMIERKPCDLRGALACFGSDAMAGKNANDMGDIMDEFGYTNVKEARRVFEGVKKAEKQADRLGLTWEDLSELADY